MMIRVFYKPTRGLKPIHLVCLAMLRGRESLEDLSGRLMIPEVFLAETLRDLEIWGLVEVDRGRLRKTKEGQTCVDVWWGTGKRGYWEFQIDQSWVLGEGTFGLNSLHERLSDFGIDLETGAVLERAETRRLFGIMQDELPSDETFDGQLDALADSIQRIATAGLSEGKESLVEVQEIFSSATSYSHINRLYGHAIRILAEVSVAAPGDKKTRNLVEGITAKVDRFKQDSLRGGVRERESKLRVYREILLATWLSGRKGLLREIAEAQPRALYVRCDHGVANDLEEPAGPEYLTDLDESRFGEQGFLGVESL